MKIRFLPSFQMIQRLSRAFENGNISDACNSAQIVVELEEKIHQRNG